MHLNKSSLLLICLFFFLSGPTKAQGTTTNCDECTCSLFGRALASDLSDPLPNWWVVRVTAKKVGNDDELLDNTESKRDMYCVKVPVGTYAYLTFERIDYEPQDSKPIDTSKPEKRHSWALRPIKLNRIRPPKTSKVEDRNQEIREILRKLDFHKETAKKTKSYDIFIWNIEVYRNHYQEDPKLTAKIIKFTEELRNDPSFKSLIEADYEIKSRLFGYIIARKNRNSAEFVHISDLLDLITDESIFAGIRADAIQVISSRGELSDSEKQLAFPVLQQVLESDASEPVRISAAETLGFIGDTTQVLISLRSAAIRDESLEVRSAASQSADKVANKAIEPRRTVSDQELAASTNSKGAIAVAVGGSERRRQDIVGGIRDVIKQNPSSSGQISSSASPSVEVYVRGDNTSNGWTDSGLVVRRGQSISVVANGRVMLGAGRFSTPEGIPGLRDNEKLMRSYPTGGLIAVIGDDNDDFIYIGQARQFTAQRDGVLFFGVNEGNLYDNKGGYNIAVKIL